MFVGRRRETNTTLPAGVSLIGGRYFWRPTTKRERDERKRDGLPMTVPLGPKLDEAARTLWAKLAGYRDEKPATAGTVGELLDLFERDGLKTRLNGKHRAAKTIAEYRRSIAFWRAKWGSCRYGKTAAEALAGHALGKVDVQRFMHDAEAKVQANRHVACLSSVFAYAIAVAGRTDYNPCIGVQKNSETPRTREVAPWEYEVLLAVATPLMALMMRYERITGWREGDVRKLLRPQLTAPGVKLRQGKRGKRQLWMWTQELREIVEEALRRPQARRGIAVFASRTGEPLTVSGFQSMWQRTRQRANRLLSQCEIPLKIEDLHFHDNRANAGDDAVEQGQDRADFLGNGREVAERHYARRELKVRPLR